MEKEWIDLFTLQEHVRGGIEELFPGKLWVKAEIAAISVKSNGHCYLELSQNGDRGVIAKARAVIWKSKYYALSAYFREATGTNLQAGMSVLLRVQVSYSELYALTLTVDDIDAEVTLGAAELEKQRTIEQLRADGMLDAQQRLELPLLPYRLAVISASTAAGYGDFCNHLHGNDYGFAFHTDLFEAAMQGAQAPESIVDALEAIQTAQEPYDAILILRGGGSSLDLACFDDYGLCLSIAQCSIPVLTAIGHDRDHHVADMVAHTFVKTPTALADIFIDCYAAEDERIASYATGLRLAFTSKLSQMESRLELLHARIHAADPRTILSRGYTLATDASGVVLKNADSVREGDNVNIMFKDCVLSCTVTGKKEYGR